jgi:predicted permease
VFGGRLVTTDLQKSFYRAGHAHAGVLVILGLLCVLLAEATSLTGFAHWLAATGVLWAAILMPAGFFFSAMGDGRTTPNRAVVLLPVGAVALAAGVVMLAVGLLLGEPERGGRRPTVQWSCSRSGPRSWPPVW